MEKKKYGKEKESDLKLVVTLARCAQAVRRAEESWIKERGVTLAQFGVIEVLYHKGNLKVGEIIEKTLSTAGNMTVVIDNLAKEGYVKKYKNPEDKREYIVEISEKGREFMENFFPEHIENLSGILKALDSKEKEKMIKLCKKLGKSIDKI